MTILPIYKTIIKHDNQGEKMYKPHEKANAWHTAIFASICGASTATTLHVLFATEPNLVNVSAGVLSGIIAIASACETCRLANNQNDMFDTMYRRNKQR